MKAEIENKMDRSLDFLLKRSCSFFIKPEINDGKDRPQNKLHGLEKYSKMIVVFYGEN